MSGRSCTLSSAAPSSVSLLRLIDSRRSHPSSLWGIMWRVSSQGRSSSLTAPSSKALTRCVTICSHVRCVNGNPSSAGDPGYGLRSREPPPLSSVSRVRQLRLYNITQVLTPLVALARKGASAANTTHTGPDTTFPTLLWRSPTVSSLQTTSLTDADAKKARPWTTLRYQAYGIAKIWEGTARLPNEPELWRQYNSTRWSFFWSFWGTERSEGEIVSRLLEGQILTVVCSSHPSVGHLPQQRVS